MSLQACQDRGRRHYRPLRRRQRSQSACRWTCRVNMFRAEPQQAFLSKEVQLGMWSLHFITTISFAVTCSSIMARRGTGSLTAGLGITATKAQIHRETIRRRNSERERLEGWCDVDSGQTDTAKITTRMLVPRRHIQDPVIKM